MSLVIKFMNAFRGSEEAHGQTTVGAVGHGKTEANSRVVREPLTEELVKNHLEEPELGRSRHQGERVLLRGD